MRAIAKVTLESEDRLKADRAKLADVLGRLLKLQLITDRSDGRSKYVIQYEIDGMMLREALTWGDQGDWRFIAREIAWKIERDLAGLNLERFRKAEVEQRIAEYDLMRGAIRQSSFGSLGGIDNIG